MKANTVPYHKGTRFIGTKDGDKHLCYKHLIERYKTDRTMGVPEAATGIMLGLMPWPNPTSPCDDCED